MSIVFLICVVIWPREDGSPALTPEAPDMLQKDAGIPGLPSPARLGT